MKTSTVSPICCGSSVHFYRFPVPCPRQELSFLLPYSHHVMSMFDTVSKVCSRQKRIIWLSNNLSSRFFPNRPNIAFSYWRIFARESASLPRQPSFLGGVRGRHPLQVFCIATPSNTAKILIVFLHAFLFHILSSLCLTLSPNRLLDYHQRLVEVQASLLFLKRAF